MDARRRQVGGGTGGAGNPRWRRGPRSQIEYRAARKNIQPVIPGQTIPLRCARPKLSGRPTNACSIIYVFNISPSQNQAQDYHVGGGRRPEEVLNPAAQGACGRPACVRGGCPPVMTCGDFYARIVSATSQMMVVLHPVVDLTYFDSLSRRELLRGARSRYGHSSVTRASSTCSSWALLPTMEWSETSDLELPRFRQDEG